MTDPSDSNQSPSVEAASESRAPAGRQSGAPGSGEPLTVAIRARELEDWLDHITRGIDPSVTYSDDQTKMMEDAYKLRGDMLYYLNHRIRAFLPNDQAD